jgi:hypothetical protein
MRSLLARLAVLGAFAVSLTACSNGTGTSLPFAGPPNNAGGVPGIFQPGSNSVALIRFVQGSPDTFPISPAPGSPTTTSVDVCIDNIPFGVAAPTIAYGRASGSLYAISGSVTHTIAVYPSLVSQPSNLFAGEQCATAPGPFFGTPPIKISTLTLGANANVRWTVVLGGTAASGTLGLYIYGDPTFPIPPAGMAAISHNAAPAFTKAQLSGIGVGFGICTTTVTPCAANVVLLGAGNVQPKTTNQPTPSGPSASTINGFVQSPLASIPAGFYDGVGVPAGNPVPITSIAAPTPSTTQPYIVQLYAIDAPAGGLNLVAVPEQTLGFGF